MTKTARLSELDALIEDLTVDAYGDQEQLSGFLSAPKTPSNPASPHASSKLLAIHAALLLQRARAGVCHGSGRATDLAKHFVQIAVRGHGTTLLDQSSNRGRQSIGLGTSRRMDRQ
jgi:hypothetical protein